MLHLLPPLLFLPLLVFLHPPTPVPLPWLAFHNNPPPIPTHPHPPIHLWPYEAFLYLPHPLTPSSSSSSSSCHVLHSICYPPLLTSPTLSFYHVPYSICYPPLLTSSTHLTSPPLPAPHLFFPSSFPSSVPPAPAPGARQRAVGRAGVSRAPAATAVTRPSHRLPHPPLPSTSSSSTLNLPHPYLYPQLSALRPSIFSTLTHSTNTSTLNLKHSHKHFNSKLQAPTTPSRERRGALLTLLWLSLSCRSE
ncbi:hypothetical protein Pmani_037966 [Petrolisthes manimaculis]|uniref:Uncharacterized protein n=1 Tax=Petrolisthes manimaculis TaxID=1843537 RepID=A0AAE1NFS2_9EUCA|nr:hypothetical protein Pmani_037966 [Petrolisthes manimaculis]